jgi:hypothetical protein
MKSRLLALGVVVALVLAIAALVVAVTGGTQITAGALPWTRVDKVLVRSELKNQGTSTFEGAIDASGAADFAGALTYSTDDLTPVGFDGSTAYEIYFGSGSSITQTTVTSATHNMTTAVDWGTCFVSDPDDDAGDPFLCTISISGTSITFQAVQDDGDNATTAATKIYYLVIGR